jgi:exopolysaccharide biosynthesis polyprenyl glycosylphosphotransferase
MDLLLINAALVASVVIGWDQPVTPEVAISPYKWYLTLIVVWVLVALFFDLYNLARAASTMTIIRSASAAAVATALLYSLIPSLTPTLQSRTQIFVFIGLAWLGIVGWRVAYSQFFVQPYFRQRALVVGAGWAGRTLASAMRVAPHDANPYRGTGYELVGFIDDNPALGGQTIENIPVLGGAESLVPMAQALEINEVILAITHRHAIDQALFDDLLRCRELGIHLTPMTDLYERLLGRVPVQHVGRDLSMALPSADSAYHRLYSVVKRLIDILSALVGLALLAIAAPLVLLANRVGSPGPLYYRQTRVGRGGRPFQVIKFRSMVPDAEAESGAVWASAGDDRITPVGRFLRRTRIDELPQFINVLRGEMSLIGPRPERPEFVEQLAEGIPFYRARHAVRPGLTGWAQVQYRYGSSVDDARIKLEYDLYYVKHISVLLDLRIALQTVPVMLQFKGR